MVYFIVAIAFGSAWALMYLAKWTPDAACAMVAVVAFIVGMIFEAPRFRR